MIFKYANSFLNQLDGGLITNPGQRIFFAYALEELEADLSSRPPQFLSSTTQNNSTVIKLKSQGFCKITRGRTINGQIRYLLQFLNAPQLVCIAVTNWNPLYAHQQNTQDLNLLGIAQLSQYVLKGLGQGLSQGQTSTTQAAGGMSLSKPKMPGSSGGSGSGGSSSGSGGTGGSHGGGSSSSFPIQ